MPELSQNLNLHLMVPEIALVALGILILLADLWMKKENRHQLGWWAAIGILVITVYSYWLGPKAGETQTACQGLFRYDSFSLYVKLAFGLTGLLVCIMSVDWIRRTGRGQGEFFTIVVFALTGMFLVSGVNDLMSMFVSLELVTLCFFILAAFRRSDKRSGEAGIKYIIVGALAAAFMLFGMAFIYGATGQVRFDAIRAAITTLGEGEQATALFGLVLLLVGLGFKVAAIPFHVWVPDVYQGAPTPVTAFMSVGSKVAGFVLIIRVVTLVVAGAFSTELTALFALIAGLTLFYGNLAAIPQKNIKRLMGYSSIGHAGYLLMGVVAILVMQGAGQKYEMGLTAILFYILAYTFTNMAVFIGIIVFSAAGGREHAIEDYAGLGKRSPLLAFCITVALLSLAGVPPLAGFFGKFYLITSVVQASQVEGHAGLLALAAIGAVNVVISMYYYLLVIKQMYIAEPTEEAQATPIAFGGLVKGVLIACVVLIIVIGVFQGPVVEMASEVLATTP
ncbi:MAG: NADH-quinone oxidoreductase subunit N [Planctomycetota bacterium]